MLSLLSTSRMAEKFRDDLFLIIKYVMENILIFQYALTWAAEKHMECWSKQRRWEDSWGKLMSSGW